MSQKQSCYSVIAFVIISDERWYTHLSAIDLGAKALVGGHRDADVALISSHYCQTDVKARHSRSLHVTSQVSKTSAVFALLPDSETRVHDEAR